MHILATRLDYKENALQIVTMCNHRKVLVSYYLFIYLWRQDLRVNTGSCALADF